MTSLDHHPDSSVKVIAGARSHYNLFGLSRNPKYSWINAKWSSLPTQSLIFHMLQADVVFFEGPPSQLSYFMTAVNSLDSPPLVLLSLPGSCRLRFLRTYSTVSWSKVKHSDVGGATDATFWIGAIPTSTPSVSSSPQYCKLSLHDILEFAPSTPVSTVLPQNVPTTNLRLDHPVPIIHNNENAWFHKGLLPSSCLRFSDPILPKIIS